MSDGWVRLTQADIAMEECKKAQLKYGSNTDNWQDEFTAKQNQALSTDPLSARDKRVKDHSLCPVINQYEVVKVLGKGTYGIVAEATRTRWLTYAKREDGTTAKEDLTAMLAFLPSANTHYAVKLMGFEQDVNGNETIREVEVHNIVTYLYSFKEDLPNRRCNIVKLYDWSYCYLTFEQFLAFTQEYDDWAIEYTEWVKQPKTKTKDKPRGLVGRYYFLQQVLNYPEEEQVEGLFETEVTELIVGKDLFSQENNFFTQERISAFLVEILCPLAQLQDACKFCHNDLHGGNILASPAVLDSAGYTYTVDDITYVVGPNEPIYKIIDFGFSRAEITAKGGKRIYAAKKQNFEQYTANDGAKYGDFLPLYDVHKLGCTLLWTWIVRGADAMMSGQVWEVLECMIHPKFNPDPSRDNREEFAQMTEDLARFFKNAKRGTLKKMTHRDKGIITRIQLGLWDKLDWANRLFLKSHIVKTPRELLKMPLFEPYVLKTMDADNWLDMNVDKRTIERLEELQPSKTLFNR